MRLVRVACALALFTSSVFAAAANGSFQLKIFEGYDFASQRVVKSSSSADLTFTYQVRQQFGMISYLSAAKIQQFQSPPNGLTASEIDRWKDYVAGPSPAYYVIKTQRGRYYLLKLARFENQGKAASYWLMTFDWQDYTPGNRASAQPTTPPTSQPKPEPPRSPDSATNNSGAQLGDAFLKATGRRDSFEGLQDHVVIEFAVQSRLTIGPRGDVYGVALFKAGTNNRIRGTLFDKSGNGSVGISPGKYDIWVLSGDDRMQFIRTVDLSNVRSGDILLASFRVDSFDTRVEDMRNGRVAPPSSTQPETGVRRERNPASGTPANNLQNTTNRDALRKMLQAEEEEAERNSRELRKQLQAQEEECDRKSRALRANIQQQEEAADNRMREIRKRIQALDEQEDTRRRQQRGRQ